ncbi:MAG: type I phosphomannose isomerase catalytic subunit [Parcubacteria group bacterium]|jgi:mannose-6-phosphate isomerase
MSWIIFQPIYKEAIWGGLNLATLFRRKLPQKSSHIAESWEIVDRPNNQSCVRYKQQKTTLREVILSDGAYVMGPRWDAQDRFPILVKLLDCNDRLSLQVHPPHEIAKKFGGDAKDEFWYVIETTKEEAQIFAGLKKGVTREIFIQALDQRNLESCLHAEKCEKGKSIFIPSGRLHAIDTGNVILEIQKNSTTTFRVYDWDRPGLDGKPRQLHIKESLSSTNFSDYEPHMHKNLSNAILATNSSFTVTATTIEHAGKPLALRANHCPRLLHVVEGTVFDQNTGAILHIGSTALLPYAESFSISTSDVAKVLVTRIHV